MTKDEIENCITVSLEHEKQTKKLVKKQKNNTVEYVFPTDTGKFFKMFITYIPRWWGLREKIYTHTFEIEADEYLDYTPNKTSF